MSKKRPGAFITGSWLASVLSLGLLYLSGLAVTSDFAQFRSCSSNNNGLSIHSCGKQSLNAGDLIMIGLLFLSALLTVSLFTASWRMVRGGKG